MPSTDPYNGSFTILDRLHVDALAGMVHNLAGERLDGWLEEAEASEAQVMRKFAVGVKKDLSVVRTGLTKGWSNGPVEGFVTKLKLLKR